MGEGERGVVGGCAGWVLGVERLGLRGGVAGFCWVSRQIVRDACMVQRMRMIRAVLILILVVGGRGEDGWARFAVFEVCCDVLLVHLF